MAARMFSEDQLEQLRSFPDIDKDDLIRSRRCYHRKHVGVVPSPRHQVLKISQAFPQAKIGANLAAGSGSADFH